MKFFTLIVLCFLIFEGSAQICNQCKTVAQFFATMNGSDDQIKEKFEYMCSRVPFVSTAVRKKP